MRNYTIKKFIFLFKKLNFLFKKRYLYINITMSITYDTIINCLLEEQKDEILDLVLTDKNDYSNISNIFNILDNNYSCYGILNYDNNNDNISIYSSILTLLDSDFILPFYKDELSTIINFKNNIINYTISNNIEFINLLYTDKLQIITNIFNINIIIFNKLDKNIDIIGCDNIFNSYKTTLLLSQYNLLFEPIINHNLFQRCFNFNDDIIKNIINNNNINNTNISMEDINIKNNILYTNIYNIDIVIIENPNILILPDLILPDLKLTDLKLNKSKLNLMKIADLKVLANKYKINIIDNDKNLLKKDIVNIIFNELKT